MTVRTTVCLLAILGAACRVVAQTTGNLEGRVTDSNGAPLAGVSVRVTGPAVAGLRTTETGADGFYRVAGVPPGVYRVSAALPGLGSVERETVVSLDATTSVPVTLRLSATAEVEVSGEASLIDLTATTTGTSYGSAVIARLPVDRNYADVVKANPGVFVDHGETQGRSLALSIYGATSAENQWIVDGVNTTNVLKGIQGKAINAEFVEEVQVKTGGYQAEYGHALGGIINVVTKSGGNAFHGDGFVYFDSAETKADVAYGPGDLLEGSMRVVDYRRLDYGVDLGGYIVRDRLWFFGAYDRVEFPATVSTVVDNDRVPSTMRFPLEGTDNLYSGKLTWNVSPSASVVGTVFADPTTNSGAGSADPRQSAVNVRLITNPDPGTWQADRYVGAADYGLRYQQLLGATGILAVQAARHQDRYWLQPASEEIRFVDRRCDGGTPDLPCDDSIERYASGGFGWVYAPWEATESTRDQYRGSWTGYFGAHEIKAGAEYQYAKTNFRSHYTGGQEVQLHNEYGQEYYQHLFFAESTNNLTPVDVAGTARSKEIGAYLQDSWRIAARWTINVGLRYDQQELVSSEGVTVLKTINEWQPRVGVTWDPSGAGRSKVYAFAGRFYYSMPTAVMLRPFSRWVGAVTCNHDPLDVTPSDDLKVALCGFAFGTGAVPDDVPLGDYPVDEGLKGIYQDEYTLGIEQVFGSSLWVGLKGTYRRFGNAIEQRCDLDPSRAENHYSMCAIVNPGSDGRIARGETPGCAGLVGAQHCSDTIAPTVAPRRVYRGIELAAREMLSDTLWLQGSFAYSSLRGDYDGEVVQRCAGCLQEPGVAGDVGNPALIGYNAYGRLFLDRPYDFRLAGFYITPFGLSVGLETWLLAGAPLDRIGFGGIYLEPRGYAGRLPPEWDANVTLQYPISVGPATVSLQAYVYNLFNNQIETSRNVDWTINPPDGWEANTALLLDPSQPSDNENYGRTTGRSAPRLFRAALKVSF
jgi:hypothetical protein